jgi:alcohol dehydrogenase
MLSLLNIIWRDTSLENSKISFRLRSDIVIEQGLLKNIKEHVNGLGVKSPLFLCDKNLETSDYFGAIKPQLQGFAAGSYFKFLELTGEPSYELLSDLLGVLDMRSIDCIVSIGGGSTMDIGKGLALLATNPVEPKTLKGFPVGLNSPLPHITVPTVLGSGAEASFNAVFIDKAEGRKLGINSLNNFPSLALVDPLLTMSAPKSVVISSALDCMVHCVDSFGSKKSTPISKMFSIEGFKNVWNFLAMGDLDEPEARLLLAQASVLGIYALMNSGDGPTNGFAYYFGVKNKIPHGMAGGMFLRDVMEWNFQNGYSSYDQLIRDTHNLDMNHFLSDFSRVLKAFSVPKLSDYGYVNTDVEDLSSKVALSLTGSFSGNPIPFNQDSAKWVLSQQFKG